MKTSLLFISGLLMLASTQKTSAQTDPSLQFNLSVSAKVFDAVYDGRVLLFISKKAEPAPRFQVSDSDRTCQVFGVNVENLKPGQKINMDGGVFGYPLHSMNLLPPGEYYVQALLHQYDTFNLSNGHSLLLPASWEAGQQFNAEPGNMYSLPQKVTLDPLSGGVIDLVLTEVVPVIPKPKETKYIKYVKMESKMLSKFWGRKMELAAWVLLPHGFEEHPEARYPLMVNHGHFPAAFDGFRVEPPDPNLEPDYSERFQVSGLNKIQQQEAHNFYKTWVSDTFPRFMVIEIQHANPYYDDSYAVNSANLGPYGDAITYEFIPFIEKKFRGIGKGWARFLYGGSTGGWEALAAQVFYPDEYNGCFAACPDPIDFRQYVNVNIYEDKNAYRKEGDFKQTLRPNHRNYLGHLDATIEDSNHKELALGDRSRSGDQWDIWQAVYSPVGKDGYPAPIWDKLTGEIDHEVARYWKENYDLGYILRRDWSKIGKKLEGKIHLYCGDMDNYYLNNAVYLVEEFLESTQSPYYNGEVAYGDRAEHCWNGDPTLPNYISRNRYNTMYVPKILKRMEATAPKGADLKSWRY